MSNLNQDQRSFLSKQKSLLDVLEEKQMVLNLDIAVAVRRTLFEAIRACGLSRGQIAGTMSEYLQRHISIDMLNAWTAESRDDYRFPLEYLPAFCHATRNYDLVALAAHALRIEIVLPDDAEEARVLLAELELRRAQERLAEMKKSLAFKRGRS